jgi:selenide, water dikinase
MRASESPVLRDIVLIGGGHSHVGVLRSFAMRPMAGVRVTLICNDPDTPYSGMLPGYVAGHYSFDDVHIDLSRLAVHAGARFIAAEVIGLDRDARRVVLRDRPALPYDVVSLNIGSTPQMTRVTGAARHVVAVKPISRFNQRWLALRERVLSGRERMTIAVVGAGAGGVELLLAMQHRLAIDLASRGRAGQEPVFHLFTSDDQILRTHNVAVRRHFDDLLVHRGVVVHREAEVSEVQAGRLQTRGGGWHAMDEVIWVTQAGGAGWLNETGLALDGNGFLRVDSFLRCVNEPKVFAAGDIAAWPDPPLEKAGVFAVRMGRPLAENLRRAVSGQALLPYRPQRRWLALISTGGRHAVASRGALYLAGDWVWRWKDWIDRRFMRRFNQLPPYREDMTARPVDGIPMLITAEESRQAAAAQSMRCGGCGAKVGATVLARSLAGLTPQRSPAVLVGLDAPDDAAIVRVPAGMAMVHTVDYFRAFIDDPYVFGRVAANHALGDIFAMGAQPQTATAIATLPPGLDRQVESELTQMMTGAVGVLDAAGCSLVGGHTSEGVELGLGFAINGLIDESLAGVLTKGGLLPGDALVLTKPIGTGVLLAAHARWQARGQWIRAALASMQATSQGVAAIALAHGARACTDVTGFGLLGHMMEMVGPSGVDAELTLSRVALLEGALACSEAGIVSSLQPANARLRSAIVNGAGYERDPRYPLLFDPQTAGGLLIGVPQAQVGACVLALRAAGHVHASVIGQVLARTSSEGAVSLRD